MNVLDLFSGIGGFSLGLERAGFRTVGFCELDGYCRQVLGRHWPDVPIHTDIRELDGEQYRGTVDLVCGGFPCQPFSVAGKQEGAADDRALWPEMSRVIREVQPSWVIGENVAGFIHMELDNCLSDLEELGYACQAFVIPACAVDARHRRDRCWILGHSHSQPTGAVNDETPRLRHVADASGGRCRREEGRKVEQSGRAKTLRASLAAHSSCSRLEGLGLGLGAETEHSAFGNPCRWEPEPGVGRVANGVPNRVDRIRGLGNAVIPQIPEIIGRAILEVEHGDSAQHP